MGKTISDKDYQFLSDRFTERNIRTLVSVPLVEGAESLIEDLLKKAYVAISSSAEIEEVKERLANRRDCSRFKIILGSHGSFHKGFPHLEYISKITGHLIEEMLMVGDEPSDFHLAREAGAKIALVAQTHAIGELAVLQPDILAPTLAELRPYLLK